jgi:hypothetical protein
MLYGVLQQVAKEVASCEERVARRRRWLELAGETLQVVVEREVSGGSMEEKGRYVKELRLLPFATTLFHVVKEATALLVGVGGAIGEVQQESQVVHTHVRQLELLLRRSLWGL